MRVLCFGDSNTYGYDPRSYLGGRYDAAARWVDLLAVRSGWEMVNAGQNGREIPRRAGELRAFERLLKAARPVDALLVMLGSNDLLRGGTPESVANRMESFLRRIPMEPLALVLTAPPPMKPGAWVTEPRLLEDSRQLSAAYGQLARTLGVRFVDSSVWEIDLTFDGVHFSPEGHRSFAEGMYAALSAFERREAQESVP